MDPSPSDASGSSLPPTRDGAGNAAGMSTAPQPNAMATGGVSGTEGDGGGYIDFAAPSVDVARSDAGHGHDDHVFDATAQVPQASPASGASLAPTIHTPALPLHSFDTHAAKVLAMSPISEVGSPDSSPGVTPTASAFAARQQLLQQPHLQQQHAPFAPSPLARAAREHDDRRGDGRGDERGDTGAGATGGVVTSIVYENPEDAHGEGFCVSPVPPDAHGMQPSPLPSGEDDVGGGGGAGHDGAKEAYPSDHRPGRAAVAQVTAADDGDDELGDAFGDAVADAARLTPRSGSRGSQASDAYSGGSDVPPTTPPLRPASSASSPAVSPLPAEEGWATSPADPGRPDRLRFDKSDLLVAPNKRLWTTGPIQLWTPEPQHDESNISFVDDETKMPSYIQAVEVGSDPALARADPAPHHNHHLHHCHRFSPPQLTPARSYDTRQPRHARPCLLLG